MIAPQAICRLQDGHTGVDATFSRESHASGSEALPPNRTPLSRLFRCPHVRSSQYPLSLAAAAVRTLRNSSAIVLLEAFLPGERLAALAAFVVVERHLPLLARLGP